MCLSGSLLSAAFAAGVPRRLPGRSYRASLSAVCVPDNTIFSLSLSLSIPLFDLGSILRLSRPWAVHPILLIFFYTCLFYSSPSPFSGPPPNISFASSFAFCPPARDSHAFSSPCVGSCRNFSCSALSLISWDLTQRRSACNVTHLGEHIRPFSRSFDCALFNGLEAPVTSTSSSPFYSSSFLWANPSPLARRTWLVSCGEFNSLQDRWMRVATFGFLDDPLRRTDDR